MKMVECSQCHRRVKNLKLHWRNSHPELMSDAFGASNPESPPAVPPSESQPQPQQPPQPNLLEKLKAFGIEPDQVMQVLSPLVEASVVKTLEKMQLGEAINKKISDVEAKLGNQIKQALEPLQQAAASQSSGNGSSPQNTIGDQVLPIVLQKLLGGGSNSNSQIEQMSVFAKAMGDAMANMAAPLFNAFTAGQASNFNQLKLLGQYGVNPFEKNKSAPDQPEQQ